MVLLVLALAGCSLRASEPAVPAASDAEAEPHSSTDESSSDTVVASGDEEEAVPAADWSLTRGRWETYTTAHGLPIDRIRVLAVDAAGELWVGTNAGGGRFDGSRWEDVVPPLVLLADVDFDAEGRAWMADGRGVDFYDGEELTNYGYDEGLGTTMTEAILVDDQGRVWVGASRASGECYGGGGGGDILLFEGGAWREFDTTGLFGHTVLDLAQDAAGDIWAVGEGGVSRHDGTAWETIQLPGVEGAAQIFNQVMVDPSGVVWVGGRGLGLWAWDGTEWQNYTTVEGLAGDTVWAIAFDGAGRVWVGTNSGLSVLDGESWVTYTVADGLACDDVRAIAIAADGVWIGTRRGLNHLVFDAASG